MNDKGVKNRTLVLLILSLIAGLPTNLVQKNF